MTPPGLRGPFEPPQGKPQATPPYEFEILEHTADVGLLARGRDLRELFEAAGYGLSSIMADLSGATVVEEREVSAEADDLEGLMVAWLSELLYLVDAEGVLPVEFRAAPSDERALRAVVGCDRLEGRDLRFGVKAITYHQLYVRYEGGRYEAQVFLDV